MTPLLLEAARMRRLAIFVGAGVSSIPPTSLPSWNGLQESIIEAVAGSAAPLCGREIVNQSVGLIGHRQRDAHWLPPQYVAEIIARRLPSSYFDVLQGLDSHVPNDVHLSVAALAKAGHVRAVITTNFDRAIEAAFAMCDAPLQTRYTEAQFDELSRHLGTTGLAATTCQLIKLHGSADMPKTLVDTLAQRKVGFSRAKATCLRHLLYELHWLFLGYSGVDLEGGGDYLFLRGDSDRARGFTWLVRQGKTPEDAVAQVVRAYGSRAEIQFGALPEWIQPLLQNLPAPPHPAAASPGPGGADAHAAAWAADRGPVWCAVILSDILVACGLNEEALALLRASEPNVSPADRQATAFGALLDAIGSLLAKREDDEAIGYFIRSIATVENQSNGASDALLGVTHHNLAGVYAQRGEWSKALDAYSAAITVADRFQDLHGKATTLASMANLVFARGDLQDAGEYLAAAQEIYERIGDEHGRALTLNNLSQLRNAAGDLDGALALLDKALAVREYLGDATGQASTLENKAHLLSVRGHYKEALALLQRADVLRQKLGDVAPRAALCNNIGMVYRALHEPDPALESFQTARALADQYQLPALKGAALVNIASIDFDNGSLAAAEVTLNEAHSIYEQLGDRRGQARVLSNRGNVNQGLGHFRQAEQDYSRALKLWQQTGDRMGEAESAFNLGVLFLEGRRLPASALPYFETAAAIWTATGSPLAAQARRAVSHCRSFPTPPSP